MKRTDLFRVFARVVRTESGCWLYQGGIGSGGYGIVSVKDRAVQAHRVAYELAHGPIPAGLCVLHRCDVRPCINPAHLFLGTLGENNTDRKQKGRNADRRGEKNTAAKLTEGQVRQIRSLYASGRFSQQTIANMFGTIQQHISDIIRGRLWPHIQPTTPTAEPTGESK